MGSLLAALGVSYWVFTWKNPKDSELVVAEAAANKPFQPYFQAPPKSNCTAIMERPVWRVDRKAAKNTSRLQPDTQNPFPLELISISAGDAGPGFALIAKGKAPTAPPTPPGKNDSASINDKFKTIIIPKVKFENLTIEEVIQKVTRAAREQDPDKKGISIILSLNSTETEDTGDANPADPAADAPAAKEQLITLELDNIPVGELIRYICQSSGLEYKLDGNLAKIASPDVQMPNMETRFFPVPAGFLKLVTKTDADADGAPTSDAVRQHFSDLGIQFDAGANVNFIQSVNQVVVTNTTEELHKVEQILKQLSDTSQAGSQAKSESAPSENEPRLYSLGDEIPGTGLTVASISADTVTLSGRNPQELKIDWNSAAVKDRLAAAASESDAKNQGNDKKANEEPKPKRDSEKNPPK